MENLAEKNGKKICLVEDDELIQEMYKVKLLQEGYEVFTANDGEEGYKIISQTRPDLALIDLGMPKMNGVDLMKMLEADEELAKIPVIILTNYDDDGTIDMVKGLQSRFYLIKALYTPAKVAGIVKEVLH